MPVSSIIWLIFTLLLFGFEAFTAALVSIWFAIGAAVAFLTSLIFPEQYLIQVVVFLIVSLLMLIITRPLAKKYMPNRKNAPPTNTDRLIGRKAVVTEPIKENKKGRVYVDGQSWSATSDKEFAVDEVCIVERIEGATVIVKS